MQNPSRLNKTEEIIKLAMLFQNSYQGLTIENIVEEMECSRRSAERMKALLGELFPNKFEEVPSVDRKKRWRFKKGTMNFLISFTSDDFANLEQLKGLTTDENKQKEVDELIAKIKALTPQKDLNTLETDIEALIEAESYTVRQYPRENIDTNVLKVIREAILSFKKISFSYTKNDGETFETVVHPYGILISDKKYLIAFNEYKKEIRQYKLGKIQNIELIDEYFDQNEDIGENFDLKEYAEKSFGIWNEEPMNVELEFDKLVKDEVLNYHFHPTQKVEELEEGNVSVKFKASGEMAICFELFKWGKSVEIKAPKKLNDFYKGYLKDCLIK